MRLAMFHAPDMIEVIWRHLEAVARPPYALSWGWIENWLTGLDDRPPLAVVHDDAGEPIAAAFGDIPVLRAPTFPALGTSTDAFRVLVDREVVTPHVDLETVRAVAGGYLAVRPAMLRPALLHARVHAGPLAIEATGDTERAHAMFDELLALAGLPDHPTFRRLIDRRAPHGEIELLRIRAGGATLGVFYNIVWQGHVAYQLVGFATPTDADLCHAAAIEHAAARGCAFYQLRPEDARLATGHTRHVILRLSHAGVSSRLAG